MRGVQMNACLGKSGYILYFEKYRTEKSVICLQLWILSVHNYINIGIAIACTWVDNCRFVPAAIWKHNSAIFWIIQCSTFYSFMISIVWTVKIYEMSRCILLWISSQTSTQLYPFHIWNKLLWRMYWPLFSIQ